MIKDIEALINAQVSRSRASLIYELLVDFHDRLPKDVLFEMQEQAKKECEQMEKMFNKVAKQWQ